MTKARLNDLTAPADEARSFDAWFFSQPKKVQEKMRNSGVLPYREMVQHRHVFAVKDEHVEWMRTDNQERVEVEAFIDALAMSDNFHFRRHTELIRWALSLPGCLSSRMIARMYGKSHEAMRKRARAIQLSVNSDAHGLFPHVNSKRDKMRVSFKKVAN